MTNKLNGIDSRPAAPVAPVKPTHRGDVRDSAQTGEHAAVSQTNEVRITGTARQLAALANAVAAAPIVDEARVAAAAAALEQGRYSVEPKVIAEKLVRMEQELARATRREK